jgi:hypothetical protein
VHCRGKMSDLFLDVVLLINICVMSTHLVIKK